MNGIRLVGKALTYSKRHVLQKLDYQFGKSWSVPDKISLTLTRRCNARCLMCGNWRTDMKEEDELAIPRWIEIIEELHEWIGPFFLLFTGGEIFVKKGVYDLIHRAGELDIAPTILTNGLTLGSEKNLDRLLSTGVGSLHISIDGIDPEIHDRFRGIRGIHEIAKNVVLQIKKRKPRVSITLVCIVMRETVDQLADYVKWATDVGADRVLFQPFVSYKSRTASWYKTSDFFIHDIDKVNGMMDNLIALKTNGAIIGNSVYELEKFKKYFENPNKIQIHREQCLLGQTNLRIGVTGDMHICGKFDTTIGNVNDGPLKETWKSERARRHKREIKVCRRPCISLTSRSDKISDKMRKFLKYARRGMI